MITKDVAYRTLQEVIGYSKAQESIAILTGGKRLLSRFANNEIHQGVFKKDYNIKLTSIIDKRVGSASTNHFTTRALKKLALDCNVIAKHSPIDPDWLGLPEPQIYHDFQIYDSKTANMSVEHQAKIVKRVTEKAYEEGLISAGAFSTSDYITAVMNSKGVFAYNTTSYTSFTLTVMTKSGSAGWSSYYGFNVNDVNPESLYETAKDKALKGENPENLPEGKYTAILEPEAVATLIFTIADLGFSALAYQDGTSFLTGKMGKEIVSSKITLKDDYTHPEVSGIPFDFEGMPRKVIHLIKEGVAVGLVYDRKTAFKDKTTSTGHALPYPNIYGPLPFNLVLERGTDTYESLLKKVKYGLLVTRFFYSNIVDPKIPSITAMTRDGTFLIKDGEIIKPLKNLRCNINILELLKNVWGITNKTVGIRGYYSASVPTLGVEGLHVTGITK